MTCIKKVNLLQEIIKIAKKNEILIKTFDY
jgi:hypothetical protein